MRSPIVAIMYKTSKIYFDVSVTFTIIRKKKKERKVT